MKIRPPKNGVSGLLFLVYTPFLFAESSPIVVEESVATDSLQPRTEVFSPPVESDAAPTGTIESQYQLQLLQQEVMLLRGLVEELSYRLDRVQSTQDDRYLELDSRLQNLAGAKRIEPAAEAVVTTPETTPALEGEDEETLYDTALELIRNRQYDLAVSQLRAVIDKYPEGRYSPNAYYWLGDVYTAMPEPKYEDARQALSQVITYFPDHQKAPHAAYKLGTVLHKLGDCQRAAETMQQIIEQQQGKTVASLAETYLRDKIDCDV